MTITYGGFRLEIGKTPIAGWFLLRKIPEMDENWCYILENLHMAHQCTDLANYCYVLLAKNQKKTMDHNEGARNPSMVHRVIEFLLFIHCLLLMQRTPFAQARTPTNQERASAKNIV